MKTRLLLTLTALLLALSSWANGTEIGGIHYVLNSSTKTASVTYTGSGYSGNTYSGSITIPASVSYGGNTYSVTSIGLRTFYNCTGLTSITIPSSVTSIGDAAFSGCRGLTSITIPSSVTSIGEWAFDGCTGLTSITIPSSSIGNYAFWGCTGLTSITIPSSVTSIGQQAFQGCTGLTSITIPSSVTSIGGSAFRGCTGLTSVTLNSNTIASKTYTSSSSLSSIFGNQVKEYILGDEVQSIGGYAFYNCTGLTSITIPSSVTSIGGSAFRGCTGLTSVTLNSNTIASKTYTSSSTLSSIFGNQVKEYILGDEIQSIGSYAFYNCSGLTSITIPSSVTSIGWSAFYGCTGLTSLTIPESVTSIEGWAFWGCTGLTSITIPSSVTSIVNSAFSGCTGLTSIKVESGNTKYDSRDNCNAIIETASNTLVAGCKTTTIPSSVTSIGDYYAFRGCTGLTSITIPSSVTSIGSSAFSGCTGLTSVTLNSNTIASKTYTSSSTLSSIFGNQVKEYILGDEIQSIGSYAFYNCSGLTSITIPSSVTSIGYAAFGGCSGLTSITIPSSVTSIEGWAFSGCTGLTSITIPSSVTSIGSSAFSGCTGLTSISIPSSVTSIGSSAFDGCTGLTSITIPSSVTSIGNFAFYKCTGLTSITIPSSVTSIGDYAFSGCTGLTSITIPSSVTSIGSSAFSGCTGLTSITIPSSVTGIGDSAFPSSCKLFVSNIGPAVLVLWSKYYTVYDLTTRNVIPKPTLSSSSSTQSTTTFKIENYNNNFSYKVDNTEVTNSNSIKLTGLKPGSTETAYLYAQHKDASTWYRINERTYTTSNISPTTTSKVTPSSVTLTPSYIKGDANVTSQKLTFNGTTQNVEAGKVYTITGLNPGNEYPVVYTIIANGYTITYNGTAKTPALTMTTQQPKVISAGNVIVAAETNLDEAETNVGFEWRRTDWTDDFSSNSGIAYLYGGTMEGYIRNLYTEKLWKYRPYYEASDGTRYYGDWVGLDPTNTSYFEPTVHTYATINVQSNTASVKGYAMRGTDNVAQQGFKYWKVSSSTRGIDEAGSRLMAVDIPAHAQTITASGQVMTATLTNLEYASDYCCVAFVTTTEGETFYGELQTFRTGEDVTGIGHVVINPTDEANGTPTIVGYYNLQGQRIAEPQHGIVIVRYSDGTSRKMYVR